MAGRLLLDSSFIIDVFVGNLAARRIMGRAEQVFVPATAMGELFLGAELSRLRETKLAEAEAFASAHEVLASDIETARHYGGIKSVLRAKGRPIPDNDIWIAALAQQHALTVATRDGHFREIATLSVLAW